MLDEYRKLRGRDPQAQACARGLELLVDLVGAVQRGGRVYRTGIGKTEDHHAFAELDQFPPRRDTQAFGGATAIGPDQAASAQLGAAVPARDHHHDLIETRAVDRRQDRATRGAGGFAVVAGAVQATDPVGPAVVGGIHDADFRNERERLVRGVHRPGQRQETAVLDFDFVAGALREGGVHRSGAAG